MRNIILIGLMGSGKTTLGRELAQKLIYQCIDTDSELESKAHMTISEIFEYHGERYFRDLESKMLDQISLHHHQQTVIATGGGIVISAYNRAIIAKLGHIVWLDSSPEVIYQRIMTQAHRPLLQTISPLETIQELYTQRYHLYRDLAHIHLNTDELSIDECVEKIQEYLS